ncbi:predicted protein [Nematostella vectensis]|uniref:Prefoldin subunit 4 n=1 Tax=Nematostella vectensis TaxID=45351 RepID=A7SUS0_NEMVE|nr:prefoldin subunit 4 [Nematostella vectensis]EDO32529.1 predicted protein [Nematostella vectensis]|eukprot:XP_001624629.1 predicted protein [Nematostella vectensis]
MAAQKSKIASEIDDTNIRLEDQQQINTFARKNAKMTELKDEIAEKKKDLQNLEDASDDLLMVDDESELIPYKVGEVFVNLTVEETQEFISKAKEQIEAEIKSNEAQCNEIKELLDSLKVKLYAKFGKNINLEADEE